MKSTLSAEQMLRVWEAGLDRSPLTRAVEMLRVAEVTEDPAGLSLGARDLHLLELREQIFGPEIHGAGNCPQCGEPVEMNFSVTDILLPLPSSSNDLRVSVGDFDVQFRLPTSADLLDCQVALSARNAEDENSEWLLERCISHATCDGQVIGSAELPESVRQAINEAMAVADPQSEIELALDCGACGNHWLELFDIESFFWSEIQRWAARTLRDVHLLASAYGWTEKNILQLSPFRRNSYLELIWE